MTAPLLELTIDLDAIVANWRMLRRMVAPAECAAVVKADCYGLGVERIAPELAAAGCASFFVATVAEGLQLRGLVPDAAIAVLSGPAGAEAEMERANLLPVLNSLGQIAAWSAWAARRARPLPALLHIDTGMTRLGLEQAEIDALGADPALLAGIQPLLVMTHFACADEADNAMNDLQIERFSRLAARLPVTARRSLAASSGIFLGPHAHCDLVRPGAALYGLNPRSGAPNPMAPVVRLTAEILQVRDVDTPMTVGYGASHRVAQEGRTATAAVGYADGYLRSLGNRGHGIIKGERVPVVGRISMDLTCFDITALPVGGVVPGDRVELIGPGHGVDELAAEAGTIGYEILTSLGHRAARRYVGGAA